MNQEIPVSQIRIGDYCRAFIRVQKRGQWTQKERPRTCQLVEIHEPILRVKTNAYKDLIPIGRGSIVRVWRKE